MVSLVFHLYCRVSQWTEPLSLLLFPQETFLKVESAEADWMFTGRPTTFPDSPSANCPKQQILDETEKAGEGLSGRTQILAVFLPQMIFFNLSRDGEALK